MPMLRKLKDMLDQAQISYEVHTHPQAFTAQEIAAAQHIPGKEMAKVVMLNIDGSLAMAVIPASKFVNLPMLKSALGSQEARLATEDEFAARFPECEIGAMPPFGNLFGLPVYADPALERDENIFFNAGNHQQTVKLKYKDFASLVRPRVVPMTTEKKSRAA